MQHPDEGTIHAWLDGQLSAEESAEIQTHAAECADCSAVIAEARGLIAASSRIVSSLDAVPTGVIPARKHAPRRWYASTQFRAAAAVLFVAGASFLVTRERTPATVQEMARTTASSEEALQQAPQASVEADASLPASIPAPTTAAAKSAGKSVATSARVDSGKAPEALRQRAVQPAEKSVGVDERAAPQAIAGAAAATEAAGNRAGFSEPLMANPVVVTGVASDQAKSSVRENAWSELKVIRTDTTGTTTETVFEISPGVQVTLEETPGRLPVAVSVTGNAALRRERRLQPVAPPVPMAAQRRDSAAGTAVIRSINWIDSATTVVYKLSGPLSVERLEQIRKEIERRKH